MRRLIQSEFKKIFKSKVNIVLLLILHIGGWPIRFNIPMREHSVKRPYSRWIKTSALL